MLVFGAGIEVFVVGALAHIDDAARSVGHGVDGFLDFGVVGSSILCHGEEHHGRTRIGRFLLVGVSVAEVGYFAHVCQRMFLGILCLLGSDFVAEDLYLVHAWSLFLGQRCIALVSVGFRPVGFQHGIVGVVTVPHAPTERHVAGIDDILHEVALVAEHGVALLLRFGPHPYQRLPFSVAHLVVALDAASPRGRRPRPLHALHIGNVVYFHPAVLRLSGLGCVATHLHESGFAIVGLAVRVVGDVVFQVFGVAGHCPVVISGSTVAAWLLAEIVDA